MPRKRTTDSAPSTPTPTEAGATVTANPEDASTSSPPPKPVSPPSSEPEVQLQPAEFRREGRQTICTVCGTEARLDLDRQLFCPNAHNHPPLTMETANS